MKVFFVTYDDLGNVEQLGQHAMSVVPRPGEVVTIEADGTASGWVVQQVAHHVGADYHQVDVTVMSASEAGRLRIV